MKIDNFTNINPVSKTLKFSLIPIGKTLENFENAGLLAKDMDLSEKYKKAKELIDRYHKNYIESVLEDKNAFAQLSEFAANYMTLYMSNKFKTDDMLKLEEKMRVFVSKQFKDAKNLFSKDMIQKTVPNFLTDENEKEVMQAFNKFTTYFANFHTIRKVLYSSDEKSNTIAYRIVNENLPVFINNITKFEIIKSVLTNEIRNMSNEYPDISPNDIYNLFDIRFFHENVSQTQIERYNSIISGYSLEDGTKIKGLNEYINNFNATSKNRLPKLQQLYKQILSETNTTSFVISKFENDNEVLLSVNNFYKTIEPLFDDIKNLFANIKNYGLNGIYVANNLNLTELSSHLFNNWSMFKQLWCDDYDMKYTKKITNMDKYIETRNAAYRSVKSFELNEIQRLIDPDLCDYYNNRIQITINRILKNYTYASNLFTTPYSKNLTNNNTSIALIKNLLDSIKDLESILKSLNGTGEETNKNELFYSELLPILDIISIITPVYNKTRNYITKKPYSNNKVKINFNSPGFLSGWTDARGHASILRKDNNFYLAVLVKTHPKEWPNAVTNDFYEVVNYKLLPGPNKMLPKIFFAESNKDLYTPSDEILEIYAKGSFKKGNAFDIDDCRKLIDFYKISLMKSPHWRGFNYKFKPTDEYENIGEFYKDVADAGYKLDFAKIDSEVLDSMIDNGDVYLFQIYNKDFSPASKGIPNLHTMYFRALFEQENLDDVVYKLDGAAEMFYRPASIKPEDMIVHPKNQPIANKNPNNPKKESVYKYDIIKDRRYTKPQFSLHISISMNFKAPGAYNINPDVRKAIKNDDENYIVGVHRGEQNLIYICVINSKSEIIEQYSLNDITNYNRNIKHTTSYKKLLESKEKERLEARQNWTAIDSIKNIKEGYIAQVVHKICELVLRYNAVVAIEDLNANFKNSRCKIEKQVYQKLEKMLIDKFEFMVNKNFDKNANGGLYHAYQLANKFESFAKMGTQNGFIFYVNPWFISKTDPATGFVNLLKPVYSNIKNAKDFVSRFDAVKFNGNYFEFEFDYTNFNVNYNLIKTKWTVCSYDTRTKIYREPIHGQWVVNTIDLTQSFIKLFESSNINYKSGDLKDAIMSQNDKAFFKEFLELVSLMLNMRNNDSENDTDYLISPVADSNGNFFDSRKHNENLPMDLDANGAYNNARKALIILNKIKNTPDEDLNKVKTTVSNEEWLNFVQQN